MEVLKTDSRRERDVLAGTVLRPLARSRLKMEVHRGRSVHMSIGAIGVRCQHSGQSSDVDEQIASFELIAEATAHGDQHLSVPSTAAVNPLRGCRLCAEQGTTHRLANHRMLSHVALNICQKASQGLPEPLST